MEYAQPQIRPYEDRDAEAVVDLSLRAWAPAFASLEQTLGSEIFRRQHPDWREDQRQAVEEVCATKKGRVWVAEAGASANNIHLLVDAFPPSPQYHPTQPYMKEDDENA